MAKILTVDKSKARLPWEEYEYLQERIRAIGKLEFLMPWEEHPNKHEMDDRIRRRLQKKLCKLVDSEEFKYYNPWYSID